jgi:threonyl-tRNA synthetase
MLIVGDKEMAAESVSVRLRSGEDLGVKSAAEFRTMAKEAVASKTA